MSMTPPPYPPKGVIRLNPATGAFEVDDAQATAVLDEQARSRPPSESAQTDVLATIDQLKRWGVPHQIACVVATDEYLRPTPAIQFADQFLLDKGVAGGSLRLGGRKKTIAIFAGPRGVGKTTAAAHVLFRGRPRKLSGSWTSRECPMFCHVDQVFASSKMVGESDKEQRSVYRRPQILVIDDLGLERDPQRRFQPYMDWLINERYEGEGWLVITTNVPADEFRTRYGERIYDRLRDRAAWYEISHESLRGREV